MKPLIAICSQDADFYLLLSHILEVEGFTCALVGSLDDIAATEFELQIRAIVLDCRPDNQVAQQSARLKQDPRTRLLPCVGLVYAGCRGATSSTVEVRCRPVLCETLRASQAS